MASCKLKRTYLSREEENTYMVICSLIQMIDGKRNFEQSRVKDRMWNEWTDKGMMTPSMQKNIKMARTYLDKFSEELFEHLDSTQQKKLGKRLDKFDFRIVDDYRMKKLFRDIHDAQKFAVIEREFFIDVLQEVCGVECVGCKKDYKECKLYTALEDALIPGLGEEVNCCYACDLSVLKESDLERLKILKDRMRSNNMFYVDDKESVE